MVTCSLFAVAAISSMSARASAQRRPVSARAEWGGIGHLPPFVARLAGRQQHPSCAELFGQDFQCRLPGAPELRNPCQLRMSPARSLEMACASVNCSRAVLNKQGTWATLKRPHNWSPSLHANNTAAGCRQVAWMAQRLRSCDVGLARKWDALGCEDYTRGGSWGLRTALPPAHSRSLPATTTAPGLPPLAVVTYASKPSKGTARLVESALRLEIPLTVLGWEPGSPKRWHEWYVGSKAVMLQLFAQRLPPDALVVFTDGNDVLFQRALPEIHAAAWEVLARSNADIVFGAEAYCYHCSKQESAAHSAAPTEFLYLNSGCLVARAAPLATLLQVFLDKVSPDARLRGVAETNASRAHEMRSLYKDATPRVFHTLNQAVLTRIFLDQKRRHARGRPTHRVPWMALDHNASFCLNLFSASPRRTMDWTADGTMRVRATGTQPPVVHYNGGIADSTVDWMEGFTAGVTLSHLRSRPPPRELLLPTGVSPDFQGAPIEQFRRLLAKVARQTDSGGWREGEMKRGDERREERRESRGNEN